MKVNKNKFFIKLNIHNKIFKTLLIKEIIQNIENCINDNNLAVASFSFSIFVILAEIYMNRNKHHNFNNLEKYLTNPLNYEIESKK